MGRPRRKGSFPGAGVCGCQVATRFGWRTHRIASIPLARVCLAFVTGREGVAHASAHASTWSGGILPRLIVPYSGASLGGRSRSLIAPGAASCSRQGNVDIVPGRGPVLDQPVRTLDEVRAATAGNAKHLRWFEVDLVQDDGTVVARVRKQVYVRRKPARS